MTDLFSPLTLRGVTLANRIGVSPMCMYCCNNDGKPTDWHLAHLLQRAVGGAGLVMAEATAITRDGRITPGDLGLWEDAQLPGGRRLVGRRGQVVVGDFLRRRPQCLHEELVHRGKVMRQGAGRDLAACRDLARGGPRASRSGARSTCGTGW